jgi:hypothetical protein
VNGAISAPDTGDFTRNAGGKILAKTSRMATSPTAVTASAMPALRGSEPRPPLVAGLGFLHASAQPGWGVGGLRDWFTEHLVDPGHMRAPVVITEPSAGTIMLHGSGEEAIASQAVLPRVLAAARIRVITALRGLIASPTDDRFLAAAIFAGRVRRRRMQTESQWVAQPEPTAPLSGVVLSLFAVDVLSHREEYDRRLCVCDVCNRVTFQDGEIRRKSCPDHQPQVSGMTRRVTPTDRKRGA